MKIFHVISEHDARKRLFARSSLLKQVWVGSAKRDSISYTLILRRTNHVH
jgi:hypothetical protein